MQVTIVRPDGFVAVDGVGHKGLNLSFLAGSVKAVQWENGAGAVVDVSAAAVLRASKRAAAVEDDGIIGLKTLKAVRAADPQKLTKRYNGFRLMFLTDLGTWPIFGRGWTRRVAHNLLES